MVYRICLKHIVYVSSSLTESTTVNDELDAAKNEVVWSTSNLDNVVSSYERETLDRKILQAEDRCLKAQMDLNLVLCAKIRELLIRVATLEDIEKKKSDIIAENITIDLKD